MKWHAHALFAVFVGALIGYLLNTGFTIYFFVTTIISSLIVDFAEKAVFNEHKRQLHSLFSLLPCIIVYLFFDMVAGAALTAGILSHILLDCLTPAGCQLLWPLQKKRFGVRWKYNDSRAREKRIIATVVLLALVTVLMVLPHGPFLSAVQAWRVGTEQNLTSMHYPDFRININDPQRDTWIHPFQNGSIFIDVTNDQIHQRSYPDYYRSYGFNRYTQDQGRKKRFHPLNTSQTNETEDE